MPGDLQHLDLAEPEAGELEHGLRMIRAGFLLLYLRAMRRMMFHLSGFYLLHGFRAERLL